MGELFGDFLAEDHGKLLLDGEFEVAFLVGGLGGKKPRSGSY